MKASAKRKIPTAAEVLAKQKADHMPGGISAPKPSAPGTTVVAPKASTAVAVPDQRDSIQEYLDEVAPSGIVGRRMKFDGKDGRFITHDDGELIAEDAEFAALCDQTVVGFIQFHGKGEPPDQVMGLLYDGFVMPSRESLGDLDQSKWPLGLDNLPADPWQHQIYLVLQNTLTLELFTFTTSSKTGRRAIGNLLRHYNRTKKTHPDDVPVVRLRVGGFDHPDERVGWVKVPVFIVIGRRPRDSSAVPDTSPSGDMNDKIGF